MKIKPRNDCRKTPSDIEDVLNLNIEHKSDEIDVRLQLEYIDEVTESLTNQVEIDDLILVAVTEGYRSATDGTGHARKNCIGILKILFFISLQKKFDRLAARVEKSSLRKEYEHKLFSELMFVAVSEAENCLSSFILCDWENCSLIKREMTSIKGIQRTLHAVNCNLLSEFEDDIKQFFTSKSAIF